MIKRLGQSARIGCWAWCARARARSASSRWTAARRRRWCSTMRPRAILRDGDLVLAAVRERRSGVSAPSPRKVLEVVGREDQPRAASLIAVHAHGVPTGFSDEAEAEAARQEAPTLKGRTDLRDLPLITIDPPDARDHDDAVYASRDDDPKNPEGWVVWVAVADVAAYVRAGTALDRGGAREGQLHLFPRPGRTQRCRTSCPAASAAWWKARTARAWRCAWCSTSRAISSRASSCAV